MYAELHERKWRHYPIAAYAFLGELTGGRSGVVAASRVQAGMRSYATYAWQCRIIPRILGGLLITMAILAITYSAAAALVNGAVAHSSARTNQEMALQHAAVNYRRARAQCLSLQSNGRDACIAEAHAEENRARVVASSPAPRRYLAALRSQADAAIDAGDRDRIIIEPACNVVSRGEAGICEIQVKARSANARAEAITQPRLIQERSKVKADKNRQLVQARANIQPGASRAGFPVRADSEAARREIAFLSPGAMAALP